jgi:phosphoribosylformylglycinamidine cyclo-ligase
LSKNGSLPPATPSLGYRDAGVDIDAGNRLVERIKPALARTHRPEVLSSIGGFGALFELPVERFRHPVLVSSTDGVGTKLKLAVALDRHDEIGVDLVAMCANDVVVQGAEPLFFLDYYATARLEVRVAERVIRGIARGCEIAGVALVGGETAEMPSMYGEAEYDLAGFCVGVVERDRIIDGRATRPGDTLIGIASSGPHSNGYSLIRKILEISGADLSTPIEGDASLADALLAPTRIYVQPLLELFARVEVRALAHITGGGLVENLPRVLPTGMRAVLDPNAWPRPALFDWIQEHGKVAPAEMLRTFNCGVGMAVCVGPEDTEECLVVLRRHGESAWPIGHIEIAAPGETKRVWIA